MARDAAVRPLVSGLQVGAQAGVLTLTLARPDRGNALDPELVTALVDAIDDAAGQDDLHTVVLRGEGRHFCTGFDLGDFASLSDGDLLLRFASIEMLLDRVHRLPLRTVAYATGKTWGAGADLFCACDHRVVHPEATFRFPGAQFGLVLGTRRLALRVGEDRARRTVIEGATLDAAAAVHARLATEASADFPAWMNALAPPAVDRSTLAALNAATRADEADRDLAALIRSAARPGLRDRIATYRADLKQK